MNDDVAITIAKPFSKITMPDDKNCKEVFNLNDEDFNDPQKGVILPVLEKIKDVTTEICLKALDEYAASKPFKALDMFDRAVFGVCVSAQLAGNEFITTDIIYRALNGETSGTAERAPIMKTAIEVSLKKLMQLYIKINVTDLCKRGGYNSGEPITIEGAILPAVFVKGLIINGQPTDAVKFGGLEPPLLTLAKLKNGQLVSFDRALLNVPKQHSTPTSTALRTYVLIRISEIKQHHMTPTLTFADIFEKCRLTDAAKSTKFNARKTIFGLFEELKRKGEISGYEVEKKRAQYVSIKFTYDRN